MFTACGLATTASGDLRVSNSASDSRPTSDGTSQPSRMRCSHGKSRHLVNRRVYRLRTCKGKAPSHCFGDASTSQSLQTWAGCPVYPPTVQPHPDRGMRGTGQHLQVPSVAALPDWSYAKVEAISRRYRGNIGKVLRASFPGKAQEPDVQCTPYTLPSVFKFWVVLGPLYRLLCVGAGVQAGRSACGAAGVVLKEQAGKQIILADGKQTSMKVRIKKPCRSVWSRAPRGGGRGPLEMFHEPPSVVSIISIAWQGVLVWLNWPRSGSGYRASENPASVQRRSRPSSLLVTKTCCCAAVRSLSSLGTARRGLLTPAYAWGGGRCPCCTRRRGN